MPISEKPESKPSPVRCVGGCSAGIAAYGAAQLLGEGPISLKAANAIYDISKNLTSDEFQKIAEATDKAFDISDLTSKGVEMIKIGKNAASQIRLRDILEEEFKKTLIYRIMPKAYRDNKIDECHSAILNGGNAFYAHATQKIGVPKDNKLPLAAFHEMGHAMNANFGTASKVLQKLRCSNILTFPILMLAILKNRKNDGEKPEGAADKAATFVKDNAGKLAFAAWLPLLLEEGIATGKGNALAKKVLSPELAKKAAKSNAFAYATYIIGAAAEVIGVLAAKTIRDKIVQGKEQ